MARPIAAAIVGFVLATTTIFDQSVHLKGGANAEPAFRDQGLLLNAAARSPGSATKTS